MSNIEIKKDHTGTLHLLVGGQPALGANVTGIVQNQQSGELQAVVVIPLKHTTLGEVSNVIPMVRAAR
jgi:hypothetical protein